MANIISANTISNPVYSSPDNSTIDCIVVFDCDNGEQETYPFTAHPDDVMTYSKDIFERCVEMGPAAYVAPPVIVHTPQTITRRQAALGMYKAGIITGPEAVAMTATGTPPTFVQSAINKMDANTQFVVLVDFASATYNRTDPTLIAIMTGAGYTESAIDDFFISSNAL